MSRAGSSRRVPGSPRKREGGRRRKVEALLALKHECRTVKVQSTSRATVPSASIWPFAGATVRSEPGCLREARLEIWSCPHARMCRKGAAFGSRTIIENDLGSGKLGRADRGAIHPITGTCVDVHRVSTMRSCQNYNVSPGLGVLRVSDRLGTFVSGFKPLAQEQANQVTPEPPRSPAASPEGS